MASRSAYVRTRMIALLGCLVALWGFAVVVTLRAGLNPLWVDTLDEKVDRPAESVITALQQERRLSLIVLTGRASDQRAALVAQRARTDEARAALERLATGNDVWVATTAAQRDNIDKGVARWQGLDGGRAAIDAATVDRGRVAAAYNDYVDAGFAIYGALAAVDDPVVARQGRTLVALSRAREILSREDALLAGVLAAGRFTPAEYSSFAQLVGTQRFQYAEVAGDLPEAQETGYRRLRDATAQTGLRALEDRVLEKGVAAPPPTTAEAWQDAVGPVLADLRALENDLARATVTLAGPAGTAALIRLVLAGVLGLAVLGLALSLLWSLPRRLARIREAAWDLADRRLPLVGDDPDVTRETPPLAAGSDEVGQVAQAFNAVHRSAVATAAEQAERRRATRDVFLNLARRTQELVHRQLIVLDGIERRTEEPADLDDLYTVDHLATRMRRHAENLILLSGSVPGRGWLRPVPLVDIVRGAIGEVEEYPRVALGSVEPAALGGSAVGDTIHLLAELVENATTHAPPETSVRVSGRATPDGYAVEIADSGPGMTDADRAQANEQLVNPPDVNLSGPARIGLYVVGRLAVPHGIRVELRPAPDGGTLAAVLIPSALISAIPPAAALPSPRSPSAPFPSESPPPSPPSPSSLSPSSPAAPLPRRSPSSAPSPRHGAGVDAPGGTGLPRRGGANAPGPPRHSAPVDATGGITANGLPRRVRQANLAAALRAEPPAPGPPARGGRTPEQVRQMMSSYQLGTVRGRSEAVAAPVADDGSSGQNRDGAGQSTEGDAGDR